MMPTLPDTRSWLALPLACALAACQPVAQWDQEFTCRGQERSITTFQDPGAGAATDKTYPLALDFHIRGQQVLVKTFQADVLNKATDTLAFGADNKTARLRGHFAPSEHTLELFEERRLNTPLGAQTVQTTGNYTCQPV